METANICKICEKQFSSPYVARRHIRLTHKINVEKPNSKHISCPLCQKNTSLGNHDDLMSHLRSQHDSQIIETNLKFNSLNDFEEWRKLENREVDYACNRRNKYANGNQYIYYECNRSNIRGYKSQRKQRAPKYGGNIQISGTCPSRILTKIFPSGKINVRYIATHIGHEDELRTKRLTADEKHTIVGKLKAGVSKQEILKDARNMKEHKMSKLNILTRDNIDYLTRKFNIDTNRTNDDTTAMAQKIEEWGQNGRDTAFLFKRIGALKCECLDNDDKAALCNHIIDVAQYEETLLQSNLSNQHTIMDTNEIVTDISTKDDEVPITTLTAINFQQYRTLVLDEITKFVTSLDEEDFLDFVDQFRKFKNKIECNKISDEKQNI